MPWDSKNTSVLLVSESPEGHVDESIYMRIRFLQAKAVKTSYLASFLIREHNAIVEFHSKYE